MEFSNFLTINEYENSQCLTYDMMAYPSGYATYHLYVEQTLLNKSLDSLFITHNKPTTVD